jgi:trimethylamine--corrinoid protein Co-methyltransferase
VDEDTLAAEVISKVGPGGHFLAERHTRDHHMKERYMPGDVIDRLSPDAWKKAGMKDATQRAKEIADETLRDHAPKPLPSESEERLETVFKAILKRHGIKPDQLPKT